MNKDRLDCIKELGSKAILSGKKMPEYVRMSKEHYWEDLKYRTPNSTESGSIGEKDIVLLYDYVQKCGCKKIVEIGTLFGVSAYTMLIAMLDNGVENPIVATCDKHYLFVELPEYTSNIRYYNKQSSLFLRHIKDEKFDMVFVDAKLLENDINILVRICNPPNIVIHDYRGHDKGRYNYKWIKKAYGNSGAKLSVKNGVAFYR